MAKRNKASHPSQYLNDLEEWNEHQYDPGHYLGGRIPPLFKYSTGTGGIGKRSRRGLGLVLLFIGATSLIVLIYSIMNGSGNNIGSIILSMVFSVISIVAGIKLTFFKS
jgi:hypothetical protein